MTSLGRSQRVARREAARPQFDARSPVVAQVLITAILVLMTVVTLGAVSNLLQLGCLALLAVIHRDAIVRNLSKIWIFLLFPALAVASCIWSDEPSISFRYGLQLFITCAAGCIVAISVGASRFLASLYAANAILVVLCLITPRYGLSMEGPVLIGVTGSKNQMAFVSQLALASAAAMIVDRGQNRWLRMSAYLTAPFALWLLIQARSATGILTAIGATGVFVALLAMRPLKPSLRVGLVLAGIMVIMPVIAAKDVIVDQAAHISATVFKKDATLTGRTYLWAQADRLISQRPVVGHGYRAVWLGESVDTTGLLRWAGLSSGKGFNFHNTYKEVTVDTGFLGLAVFSFSFALIGFLSFSRFLADGTLAAAFFFSTFLTYAAKSFTELIIGPFATPTLLLFAMACHAVLHRELRFKPRPQLAATRTQRAGSAGD